MAFSQENNLPGLFHENIVTTYLPQVLSRDRGIEYLAQAGKDILAAFTEV
uniref:Uncharacterized protein n=1 Tax=Candidatus Kentrum eta TaxID=2126337 RepID=A0A450U8U0_9GAMM|nr:MAG: hypothetical protein BECKH772A_GA0070896_1000825 [Candidatus Kentron sp. H]VFJ93518.1 MAG: hypothetical protein BECKH772B_GA0070898_100464 [Candidatus Kentron sp. H]VFJ94844.1 MAG: hypothetical protein BECKH772C_GA0070978_1000124 [Candidatus Kentron sp. H]